MQFNFHPQTHTTMTYAYIYAAEEQACQGDVQLRLRGLAGGGGADPHAVSAEADGQLLPVLRVPDHAAVHGERGLEHPRQGEADQQGAGRPPRQHAAVRPQRQARAAAQRQGRPVLQPAKQHHLLPDVNCRSSCNKSVGARQDMQQV
jgi:hypothetical protein